MANFNFKNLILVNPCKLENDAYTRAMHAGDILDNAKIFKTFEKAVKKMDFMVASSSIDSKNERKHLRNSVILPELSKKINDVDGKIGLIFGREDYGLFNEEIAKCDIMLRIPTSESYHSLNLSHAVGLVLYSLFINEGFSLEKKRTLSSLEKNKLNEFFLELLKEIN